ncbi:hypothetical protein GQ457_02G033080 [Hibiscus cannabinus]
MLGMGIEPIEFQLSFFPSQFFSRALPSPISHLRSVPPLRCGAHRRHWRDPLCSEIPSTFSTRKSGHSIGVESRLNLGSGDRREFDRPFVPAVRFAQFREPFITDSSVPRGPLVPTDPLSVHGYGLVPLARRAMIFSSESEMRVDDQTLTDNSCIRFSIEFQLSFFPSQLFSRALPSPISHLRSMPPLRCGAHRRHRRDPLCSEIPSTFSTRKSGHSIGVESRLNLGSGDRREFDRPFVPAVRFAQFREPVITGVYPTRATFRFLKVCSYVYYKSDFLKNIPESVFPI